MSKDVEKYKAKKHQWGHVALDVGNASRWGRPPEQVNSPLGLRSQRWVGDIQSPNPD